MDHLCASVRVIERVTKLTDPAGNLIRFKDPLLFLGSQVRQRFTIDILHGNTAGAFVVYKIVDPNDVRMGQFEAAFCLAFELIEDRTIVDHKIREKLQRDIALQFFIVRQPDNPHSTSPEHLHQRVTAKDFLSCSKLMRGRVYDIAWGLVTHLGSIFMIKMERKVKAKSG